MEIEIEKKGNTGFYRGSHGYGTLPCLFRMGNELHMIDFGFHGNLFEQAPRKFLLDLSKKVAIESNSHYIMFISRKKESTKCRTGMRTPGKPCKD